MESIFNIFFLVIAGQSVIAYDLLEGLIQLAEPCFETIHGEECNSSLPQAFTPPLKGVDINTPDSQIYLFTSENPDKGEPLHKCGGKLPKNSNFDKNVDTVFITHGWLDGVCRTAWMREMNEQLHQRGKYNVILVDWTWGNTIDPAGAGANALLVGQQMAFVIFNIMKQTNMKDGDRFHLIGHSYGSFVVNEAGEYIYKRTPEKRVRRMTLLDPAVSPFKFDNPRRDLPKKVAKFVDVIHGDAGDCFPLNVGIYPALGHVDFYPNGGDFQLACYTYALTSLLKGDLFYAFGSLLYPPFCSHLQTIQYFKVSINQPADQFVGVLCKNYTDFFFGPCKKCCNDKSNCAVMGMNAEEDYFDRHGNVLGTDFHFSNKTYYMVLGAACPYNENYEFSTMRDCQ